MQFFDEGYTPALAQAYRSFPAKDSTLDLDFINNRQRVAGVANSESGRINLLTYSEQFDNAAWGQVNMSVTPNGTVAPSGATTADTLTSTATPAYIYQDVLASGSGTYTISFYFHTSSTTTSAIFVGFFTGNSTENAGTIVFNPSTGAFISATDTAKFTLTSVGSGWYRVSYVCVGTNALNKVLRWQLINNQNSTTLVVWGAQLERGSVASAYIPTTSAPLYSGGAMGGVTFTRSTTATYFGADGTLQTAAINEPRFEYDPILLRPLGLLIEESRANILLNSDVGATQSVSVSATPYTLSFWGTGTVTLSGVSTAGPLVGVGDNTRVTLTFTPTAGTLTLTVSGAVTKWQLEAGNFATSYIPTTSASVTRGADMASMTGANFSSWYSQARGTFLAAFRERVGINTVGVTFRHVFHASGTADATSRINVLIDNTDKISFEIYAGGAAQAILTGQANTGQTTACIAYNTDDAVFTDNGAPPITDTSVTTPTLTQIQFGKAFDSNANGYLNGHIERLIYYPKRLPNNLLQYLSRLTA